jgi:trehalose synthase
VRILHVNSTRQGGGVAEILSSLTPLMNELGIVTEWHVIEGSPEFFAITKSIHNGLQGQEVQLGRAARSMHRDVALANAETSRLEDYDVIIVHDPQPLPLIAARKDQIWIWCCHIDLSAPDTTVWQHLAGFADRYDTIVLSLPEYAQPTRTPQRFILPAIDPFSTINQEIRLFRAVLSWPGVPRPTIRKARQCMTPSANYPMIGFE